MGRAIGDARKSHNLVTRPVKDKDGNIVGEKLYVRMRYTDKTGKRKSKYRLVRDPAHAKKVVKELVGIVEKQGAEVLEFSRKTFAHLVLYYKEHYAVAAEYSGGRKIAGRRSLATVLGELATLAAHFGKQRLQSITYENIRAFKLKRIRTPIKSKRHEYKLLPEQINPRTKRKNRRLRELDADGQPIKYEVTTERPRSLTSVNRELQLLRHMLNVAMQQKWITENPFKNGAPLIQTSDEQDRKRIMTYAEEKRAFTSCMKEDKRWKHLLVIIMALVDTAMRSGEAFKLKLKDIAFNPREFSLEAFNTKTMTARSGPISLRLAVELQKIFKERNYNPEAYVFGYHEPFDKPLTNVQSSWESMCEDAGIADLRLKDLRRTAATRLLRAGMDIEEISRILGHTDITTTFRYIGVDRDTNRRAADALDTWHAAEEERFQKGENDERIH